MGSSIDEQKPFMASYDSGRPHLRSGFARGGNPMIQGGSPLQQWVRRRWPLLLAASLGALYLLRSALGAASSPQSAAGSDRLSSAAGGARVQECVMECMQCPRVGVWCLVLLGSPVLACTCMHATRACR